MEMRSENNLRDFKKAAEKVGMKWMIMEGTLLGAYRDHNFVKDDASDIDLGIMEEEFYKLDEAIAILYDYGFDFPKIVNVDGEFHGGALVRGDCHIDLMKMKREGDIVYNLGEMGGLIYEYSADIFDGYSEIEFRGMKLNTPAKIEKYLETRYGDWKTPVGKDEYDYANPKYSPNVRRIC